MNETVIRSIRSHLFFQRAAVWCDAAKLTPNSPVSCNHETGPLYGNGKVSSFCRIVTLATFEWIVCLHTVN